MKSIFYVLALLSLLTITVDAGNCYENWSRCTPETRFATGVLWKSCPQCCERCKGRETGGCERVYNKQCSGGFQCKCFSNHIEKSGNWIDIATCALGL